MILAILNQKGGAGKTTISVNLSRALQISGDRVIIVDSDPQGSARDWGASSKDGFVSVIGLDRPTLNRDIQAVSSSYDWVVIDGAPQLADMSISAIKCADVVLIPVQPSPYDIWATSELVEVIKARQEIMDGKPKAAFLISRQIANTNLAKEVREVLVQYDLPVFKHGTFQRVIYPKTAAIGSTVLDMEPNGEASKEMNLIVEELREFIK